jgi:23S rRNA (uridine2552-2'-O)-methyltransferase
LKLSDARKDHYRKFAKDKGYRSRSAYKLLQLNNSYHIFRQRNKVLDLGCAPGGWLQVAIKEVGSYGKVIGIDLKEVKPLQGAIILHGNIEDKGTIDGVIKILNSKADVVLSDLSPNVSGIWGIDHARQISLTKSAFSVVQKILREDGNAIFKVFEGDLLNEVKDDLNSNFHKVLLTKPGASRQQSSELYIVCLKFRG